MHTHAPFNFGDKQRHVLLCRHLALPHLLPIIQKSETRSQFYAVCNLSAKDLAMNSQVLGTAGRDTSGIILTRVPALQDLFGTQE